MINCLGSWRINTIFPTVRIINTMKKIIVLFAFLPFATTDSVEDYPPNPQYDRTEFQINAIIELLQLLDKQTIKKTFDKWISQNRNIDKPWKVVNSKNISFTKFMTDEDIISTSSLTEIYGHFNIELNLSFENKPKAMEVDGTIEFLRSGNHSACQATFNFKFKLVQELIAFLNMNDTTFHDQEEVIPYRKFNYKNFANIEWDQKSCENINGEDRHPQSIHDDILQATKIAMTERLKLIKKSIFQSISNKWINPGKNSYPQRKNYYSRFKIHSNIDTFPWMFDHNEFIINGLNNFRRLSMKYLSDKETTYELQWKNVKIHWNIASVTMMQLIYDIREFRMKGSINELIPNEDFEIELSGILDVSNQDYTAEMDINLIEKLQVLIALGIKQTFQKIRYDGTKEFIKAVQKILRPFDEKSFQKSLIDLEKVEEENFPLGTISNFMLNIEDFHLKNITRLDSDELKVGGILKYEKINGQADILLQIANNKVHSVPVSVNIFIKDTKNIGISLNHSNFFKDDAVKINVNWSDIDTTITITSSLYRLSQQERITVGKQLFQYFTKKIENQIINVVKSTFHPIFDIHKNSFKNSTFQADHSNTFHNQKQYFALIRDYWDNTMKPNFTHAVEITIEGSWNFNTINLHYLNGKLSIDDLQLENVTASIKQFTSLNDSVTINLIISHFSIIINHTENKIFVKVPFSDQNAADTIEKFESTVASFIGYLIYGNLSKDSNYRVNFRKFFNDITKKAISEDATISYDASSMFTANFIHILEDKELSFYDYSGEIEFKSISSHSDYISNITNKHHVEPSNIDRFFSDTEFVPGIEDPLIQDEICVNSNNSLSMNNTELQFVANGKFNMQGLDDRIDVIVSFTVSSNRVINVIDNYYNETAYIYIDDENIKDILITNPLNKETPPFNLSNETLKTELAFLTSSYLRGRLEKIPHSRNFCKPKFGFLIPPEKYFFLIASTVDYPSQLFSTYHIKLYGLQNFKMLRTVYSETVTEFEITITNLTARIIWNHYNGDYIRRTPKIMNLKICEIKLCAKISFTKRLIFIKKSRMLLLGRENSAMVKKLEEKVESIVISAIQQKIQQEYNKINGID